MTDNNEETTVHQSPEENEPQAEQQAPEATPKPKLAGLVTKRNIMFGGGGLLVVILVIVGILMFTGSSEETAEAPAEDATEQHEAAGQQSHDAADHADQPAVEIHEEIPGRQDQPRKTHQQDEPTATVEEHAEETFDELFSEDPSAEDMSDFEMPALPDDSGVMATIMENLEFLDYSPDMEEEESDDDLGGKAGMTAEDSVAETNWIAEEKARLKELERELAERERKLQNLDKKIAQKMLYLERTESERIATLAKLYDNMDPRAVVQLMANLDDETVVSLIPRMKPKNASAVLQLMSSARAARLSKQMISIAVSNGD